jgi:adenine-specific DNA-methyltransferase
MAAINDLISQIENPELRDRILAELDRMNKQKKFGLVFEEHLPESVKLYDLPVKKGSTVMEKAGGKNVYKVLSIADDIAECIDTATKEVRSIPVAEIVSVALFGTPIYPYLKPLDSICNAPDSDLWHTLIEADNYHAWPSAGQNPIYTFRQTRRRQRQLRESCVPTSREP